MHPLPRHHIVRKPSFPLHHGYESPSPAALCNVCIILLLKKNEVCLCSGGGECDPGESHENDVIVYGRSEGRRERVVLDTLPYSSYRVRHTQKFIFFSSYNILLM